MTSTGSGGRRRSRAGWLLVPLVMLALSPAAASADVLLQPILPLGTEGPSLGDAELATRTEGGDVFVAISAPAVSLAAGAEFRLVSCVQTHVLHTAPAADCSQRDVDTRQRTEATAEEAPIASRQIAAPPASQAAWATGVVEVLRRSSTGGWQRAASSWTPGGLATASLPLSDRGLPSPLAPQGVALEAIADGGMNTGARDSICAPLAGATAQPLPDGVTSGALGGEGPAYSETGSPLTADHDERGVVLLLHGGGWMLTGSWAAAGMRPDADRWRARGWRTVNASYRACGGAIEDVVAFVDHIRARILDSQPLCLVGTSAGAHLALLAAALRPDAVDCVVSQSGPTDLAALAAEQAYDPFTGDRWATGPIATHNLAVAAFGAENLAAMSPARQRIAARLLVAVGEHDWLLAPSQATSFASAQRALDRAAHVEALILPAGTVSWGHGSVSSTAIEAFHAAEAKLGEAAIADRQASATSSPPAGSPSPAPVPTAPPSGAPPALADRSALPASVLLPDPLAARRRSAPASSLLALSTPDRARRRHVAAGGTLRIRVRARRGGTLNVTIRMRGRVVARADHALTAGRSTTAALRVDRRARAWLRRVRRGVRLQVSATLRDGRDRRLGAASRTIQLVG